MVCDYKSIIDTCERFGIENYTINEDMSIDINGDFDISCSWLFEFPIEFNIINGDFDCSMNLLTSLKGGPKMVMGNFTCSDNQLQTLDYLPYVVKGSIDLEEQGINNILRFSSVPNTIGGVIYCSSNNFDDKSFDVLFDAYMDIDKIIIYNFNLIALRRNYLIKKIND